MTLDDYLTKNDISTAQFAAIIKVKPETVRRYRNHARIPEPKYMSKIFAQTGGAVTANDFYDIGVGRSSVRLTR